MANDRHPDLGPEDVYPFNLPRGPGGIHSPVRENPKEAAGGVKVPLHLCPDTVKIAGAMAFLEGATKYGAHNWRGAGVTAGTYKAAMERHMIGWWNGENIDPESGLPHLWKLLACVAVLIDASIVDKVIDDRPPMSPVMALMKALEPHVAAIKAKNADKNPRHWTIADSNGMPKLPASILGAPADHIPAPKSVQDEQLQELLKQNPNVKDK